MRFLEQFNDIVGIMLFVVYLYQIFYTLYALARTSMGKKEQETGEEPPLHRFAAIVCARNEEHVIGELIASLKAQDYPASLLDIYVLADNCTDGTAQAAREAGAIVYERADTAHVGKGYALDYLFKRLMASSAAQYDAYLVFDADNIVHKGFVRR